MHSKAYIEDSLCMRLGGRMAEQIVFGMVSTGAQNDLVVNTELARRMVREWGMSDRVGPMAWGSQGQVFLGDDLMHTRDYSDDTARVIDEEVERILREQEDRASQSPHEAPRAASTSSRSRCSSARPSTARTCLGWCSRGWRSTASRRTASSRSPRRRRRADARPLRLTGYSDQSQRFAAARRRSPSRRTTRGRCRCDPRRARSARRRSRSASARRAGRRPRLRRQRPRRCGPRLAADSMAAHDAHDADVKTTTRARASGRAKSARATRSGTRTPGAADVWTRRRLTRNPMITALAPSASASSALVTSAGHRADARCPLPPGRSTLARQRSAHPPRRGASSASR